MIALKRRAMRLAMISLAMLFALGATLVAYGFSMPAVPHAHAAVSLEAQPSDIFAQGKVPITRCKIVLEKTRFTYTGREKKPNVVVRFGGTTLKKGSAYSVSYSKNVEAGVAKIKVAGKGKFTGSKTIRFKIVPAALSSIRVRSQTYTGKALRPVPMVKASSLSVPISSCKTSYSNNVKTGIATVRVKGKGNFTGTLSARFKVKPAHLSKVSIASIKSRIYTGKGISPNPKVALNGLKLKKGRDYVLAYAKNVNVGNAIVKIAGKGNFEGARTVKFAIEAAPVSAVKIASIGKQYTTCFSAVRPKPHVTFNGTTLVKGVDYTVSYSNNKLPGTASLTVKAKSPNFTGTTTKTFKLENMGDRLARMACKLSYSRSTYCSVYGGWPDEKSGTLQYREAFGKYYSGQNPRDCVRGMTVSIRESGFDPDYPKTLRALDTEYADTATGTMRPKGELRWKLVGAIKNTSGAHDWISNANMQAFFDRIGIRPGDVLVQVNAKRTNGHTCMYVGDSIPQSVYKSYLKGRGISGGDVGEPESGACWVSSHLASLHPWKRAALCIQTQKEAGVVNVEKGRCIVVYRCVNPGV